MVNRRFKRPKSDKPKKMVNAYMQFCLKQRQQVKQELRTCYPRKITRELGVRWRALEKREKEQFEELAKLDNARYKREMAEYRTKKAAEAAGLREDAP